MNLLIRNVLLDFNSGVEVVVVDDLRFKNEYDSLDSLDFEENVVVYLVKIEVDPHTQAIRGAAMDRSDHPSETDLDGLPDEAWSLIIPEDSTVEQRVQWIEQMVGIEHS